MKKTVLFSLFALFSLYCAVSYPMELPTGATKPALDIPHFPDKVHAFVWRNWESVRLERMAAVLETTPENVRALGLSMGLPPYTPPAPEIDKRGYISLIRRNWHLLPYDQLLALLDWKPEQLAFALQEDDFLWVKLGGLKPECPPLRYRPPTKETRERCAAIKRTVEMYFGKEMKTPREPRFTFIGELSAPDPSIAIIPRKNTNDESLRYLYSYFSVFGDPLLDPSIDPYPEGILQRLSERGVTGVWMHTVLRQLAPSDIFPEERENCEIRLKNLAALVDKCGKYGIKIYLYMNEPRSMPDSFFNGREHLRGGKEGDYFALCTSEPEVRAWLKDSLRCVFSQIPDLGGVFTITASENFTNCWSHGSDAAGCSRCSKRSPAEVIAEVNRTIEEGVHAGSPKARVIAWDWGWRDDWAEAIINGLPDNVYQMSVSEWSLPIERGGIRSEVGEYSISSIGPGPRALHHWTMAKRRGLKTVAKMQVNCSWELSALPYLPVMNTIERHCRNLAKTDIDGMMLSWSVGGYPSPNLELVAAFENGDPGPNILTDIARKRYGSKNAVDAVAAWTAYSDAFSEYPFHIGFVYTGPVQMGAANLFFPRPTGYKATMVGFPYDDVDGWRAVYPADVMAGQFEKVAVGWGKGLDIMKRCAERGETAEEKKNIADDLRIAEAAMIHFSSVARQIRFTESRNRLLSESIESSESTRLIAGIEKTLDDEIAAAQRMFLLSAADSRIGYEASNHYYYFPLDFVEKVIDCEYIRTVWLPEQEKKSRR